jgi:hypothetical protein
MVCLGLALGGTAEARKRKRHHKSSHAQKVQATPAPAKHDEGVKSYLPPKVDNKAEYERAQAQIEELKNAREIPVSSMSNQESDRELPGQKQK